MTEITVTADGVKYADHVEPRMLLVHYLREVVGKTGRERVPLAAVRGHGAWGSLTEPRFGARTDGGGTTGPMSPSGASSRSAITGA